MYHVCCALALKLIGRNRQQTSIVIDVLQLDLKL